MTVYFKPLKTTGLSLCLAFSFQASAALDNLAENSVIFNQFTDPVNVALDYGDVLFTPDGNTIYIIINSEEDGGKVVSAAVNRDPQGHVIGFGTFTDFFSASGIDTGLTYAPNSETLFFHQYGFGISQRLATGEQETHAIQNYDGAYGGLAFIPEKYSHAGKILKADYTDEQLWLHDVTVDGDDTYTLSLGTLVSDIETTALGDIEYITSGPLADHLIVANYGSNSPTGPNDLAITTIPVDATTGLPNANPVVTQFAGGTDQAWGLTIDPITGNLWVIEFSSYVMTQIIINDIIFNHGFE